MSCMHAVSCFFSVPLEKSKGGSVIKYDRRNNNNNKVLHASCKSSLLFYLFYSTINEE